MPFASAGQAIGDELLSIAEVAAFLGVTTKSVYRYRAAGRFPDPVRVGPRLIRWPKSAIAEWVRSG